MSIELKIKAKHLALEPNVIRCEERKLISQIKWLNKRGEDAQAVTWKLESLSAHRRWNVRNESRATNLARAYLAGKPYSYAEKSRKPENEVMFQLYIIPRIIVMVSKYGRGEQRKVTKDIITAWCSM
jgi:hypothetical protein